MITLGGDLPPNEEWKTDEEDIIKRVIYSFNNKGQKIKTTNIVRVTTEERKIPKAVYERKQWENFGKARREGSNKGCTIVSKDSVKHDSPR